MPRLRDILANEARELTMAADLDEALLDQDVVAIRLTTGAPCSSHSELFAPWPGPERGIERWFVLAGGTAVGVMKAQDGSPCLAVADEA